MNARIDFRGSIVTLVLLTLISLPVAGQLTHVPDTCDEFKKEVSNERGIDERRKDEIQSSSILAHTLIWENDVFAGGGDYNYTNGMKLSWLHNPCRRKHEGLKENFKDVLASILGEDTEPFAVHSSGVFGMNMYTPNDLRATTRITTDRPYVGWLYGGINLQATRSLDPATTGAESETHQLELHLGFTGPKTLQREAQDYIHRNITNSQLAQAWDSQIEERIGINALYMVRREWRVYKYLRAVPHAGFSIGNLMQFLNAGGMVLLGKSNSEYPGTTNQPSFIPDASASIKPMHRTPSVATTTRGPLVTEPFYYGFVGVDARYVFNSVFVEGFDKNANDIDLIHGVYDLIAGFAVGRGDWRFSYKIIWRSKEFHSPDARFERSHRIGQLGLTWLF